MQINDVLSNKTNKKFIAVQGMFWASTVAYYSFTAVFLQFRGVTNSQIGFTLSGAALGSMVLQTLISDFSDKHPRIPLKKIISILYLVIMMVSASLALIPSPIAFVMCAYIIGQSCINSLNALINAMFMQLQNAGLKLNFGIARGTGSVLYAILTVILGIAVEKSSPEILPTIQIIFSVLAISAIMILPRPESVTGVHPDEVDASDKPKSMFSMLKGNPTFVMLMVAMAFTFIGQTYYSFFINIINSVGGNTADLGKILFVNASVELLPLLFASKLLKRFSSKHLMIFSLIFYVVKTAVFGFAPNLGWIYFGAVLSIFANGIFFFSSMYFINEIVKPNERTRGQALIGLSSFSGLGTVVGATLNGMIIDRFGISTMMHVCLAFNFIGISITFVVSFMHKKHFLNAEKIKP